jgi:hypothetical protein
MVVQVNPAFRLIRNYGIALVVVAALIRFPLTGFMLTILTLGLVPALVCNLFLIHLAVASAAKRISRRWLALPILSYGAWLGWLAWQTWLRRSINGLASVPLDPPLRAGAGGAIPAARRRSAARAPPAAAVAPAAAVSRPAIA